MNKTSAWMKLSILYYYNDRHLTKTQYPQFRATLKMDSGGGAYGAGKATGQFDPLNFIKKPHVIVRLISLVSLLLVL